LTCQKGHIILHTEGKQCHLLLSAPHLVRGCEHIPYAWYLNMHVPCIMFDITVR